MFPKTLYSLCGDLPPTSKLQKDTGVYYIVAANKDGSPAPLCRVGGVDPEGILYIGRSKLLRKRLQKFRNMVCTKGGDTSGHAGARSYLESMKVQKLAPARFLLFRYSHCASPVKRERKELLAYRNKFGGIPPLNYSR